MGTGMARWKTHPNNKGWQEALARFLAQQHPPPSDPPNPPSTRVRLRINKNFQYRYVIDIGGRISICYWYRPSDIDILLIWTCGYRCLIDMDMCISISYWYGPVDIHFFSLNFSLKCTSHTIRYYFLRPPPGETHFNPPIIYPQLLLPHPAHRWNKQVVLACRDQDHREHSLTQINKDILCSCDATPNTTNA